MKQNLKNINSSKEVLDKLVNLQIHGSCCNKLVKRSCCNGISFTPESIVYAEDELFNIRLLNGSIEKVAYLSKAFYHYVQHTLSLTAFADLKVILSRIREVEEIEKLLDSQKYDDFFAIKREILFNLYETKNLSKVKPFEEVHSRIIEANKKYKRSSLRQYFFARALKGNSNVAYNLYCINIFLIKQIQILKKCVLEVIRR